MRVKYVYNRFGNRVDGSVNTAKTLNDYYVKRNWLLVLQMVALKSTILLLMSSP